MPIIILILAVTAAGPALISQSAQGDPASSVAEPSAAPSEFGMISCLVLAKGSGAPLKRVEIRFGNDKIFTDPEGKAAIPQLGDQSSLTFYKEGFESITLSMAELKENQNTVFLYPATPADNEVLVVGQRRPETSRKTISVEEAVKVAPNGDPAQVPKLLPGVQAGFRPEVIVRGSGPFDSKYYIEDWSIPFIFHRIGNLSIIPEQLLSNVEFSSGGFGAQDGNATGGLIKLRTKDDVPERPKTEVKVNIPVLSGIYHERPVDDPTAPALVAGGVRRSYLEYFLRRAIPKDSGLTVVPYFGDAHLYYYRPTDDGHLKLLMMHAFDGMHALFPGGDNEEGRGNFDLKDRVSLLGVQSLRRLNSDWSLTFSPALVDVENKIHIIDNRIDIRGTSIGAEAGAIRRLGGKSRLYLGSSASVIQGHAKVLAPIVDNNDPFFDFEEAPKQETNVRNTFTDTAAWAALDIELGSLLLMPGLRGQHSSSINRSTLDPRLAARYQLTSERALKGATGLYSQTPEFRDSSRDFGNPHLQFIRAQHYVLGIEEQWGERWTTELQGYYKETKNLVRADPVTHTNNDGSLISRGFEVFIRRNLTQRFFGWLSYTYSVTRERDNDEETYRRSRYDQSHVGNLVGNYKLTAVWELGGRLVYHSGDTYTTVDDAVYNANLDKYQPRTDPQTRPNEGRLPAYHEADIYCGKDFLFDTWKLATRFGVQMLALRPQAVSEEYNYDYSDMTFFRGIPPIPYIEAKGVF